MAKIYGERWEVIKTIGEGGQAFAYLVKDRKGEGEMLYVLKRLKNLKRIERFKREVEAIRSLAHENIVQQFDFDLESKEPYLVTEYCEGGSLSKAQPFWRKSPTLALELFQQICQGVAYAHAQGIVHRDLKPDNIFLRTPKGPAVVGDFGICFFEEDGTRVTITEEAVGPRLYMAPELADGRLDEITTKCDVYSLGKVLYWLLSGKEFDREKHREPSWDLKGRNEDSPTGWNNIYLEHVNRLLDLMIVVDKNQRRSANNILILSRRITRLVEKEFNPISKHIKQPCRYCGIGHYLVQGKGTKDTQRFGLPSFTGVDWRVLVCDSCGHIQHFSADMANEKHWWT